MNQGKKQQLLWDLTAKAEYIGEEIPTMAFTNVVRKRIAHSPIFRLTHWGQVTQICAGKLTIIGSDNGLSPGRHQAIIWINDGMLLIGP